MVHQVEAPAAKPDATRASGESLAHALSHMLRNINKQM